MITLEEAQARLLALAVPLPVESIAVEACLGRYLAEPLIAARTQPAADMSAMDGYAVLADDLSGPWAVIGESAAGHPFSRALKHGEAVRISTGAHMPSQACAVIVQEDIARDGNTIRLTADGPARADQHIRQTGQDFCAGDELLAAGCSIGPAQIALAMTAGHAEVSVCRAPRIAIIDSGDELAAPESNCLPHQIPASNGAMLSALCAQIPCTVERIGPVPDDAAAIRAALDSAADADVIVTSGGASVGDHDLIRPVMAAWGAEIDFWRVAIKPGKPVLVGRRGPQIVLGLPGNPVSCYVTSQLFLLPLLRHLLGAAEPMPRAMLMALAAPLGPGGGRREFLRARWTAQGAAPLADQSSGGLAALAHASLLIDRAAGAEALAIGGQVAVLPL